MIVSSTIWHPDLTGVGRAKYLALAEAIRSGIRDGHLNVAEKLPPVRELAYQIGVTPGTVARAYGVLIDEGLLEAGVGRGTFVAAPKRDGPISPLVPAALEQTDDTSTVQLMSPKMPDLGQGDVLRAGMRHFAETASARDLLHYPSRLTDFPARKIFCHDSQNCGIGSFSPDDVVLSHGGQSGIVMILQTVLHGSAPVVLLDELSYAGFRRAAELCRAEFIGVPWDTDGPDPVAFEALVQAHKPQAFCTSAEVCNPTGKSTTLARRKEIAAIAKQHGVHIIDDDCYGLFRGNTPKYREILPELGWYVTSPSKSLTASLRLGFVVAPDGWANALIRSATFNSFGIARPITDLYSFAMRHPEIKGIQERIRQRINSDVQAAAAILAPHSTNCSDDVPFLWLDLPRKWRAGEFCQAAEGRGILIRSAEDFALRESRRVHAVRIAINGQIPHETFATAMRELRDLLDSPPEGITV